jgi:hypothetical protein
MPARGDGLFSLIDDQTSTRSRGLLLLLWLVVLSGRKVACMTSREAACSCGQLSLTVNGDPLRVSMCHCLECQRRTGSTFGVQAWYSREQVQPAGGVAKQYTRRADSGRSVTFNFCPNCGGTVFWAAAQRPDLVGVAVGMFADPAFDRPAHSVWERSQHPWTVAFGELIVEHLK